MSWNYRILRHSPKGKALYYGLHEVYYDDKNKPFAWTHDSMCGYHDTPKDLIKALSMMLKDARKCKEDIMDYGAKPKGKMPKEEAMT